MLNLRHVSYAFGTYWVLKNLSFQVEPGGFTFLFGPSGAGKTTLLRLLHGSLSLQRGAASVAGFDLASLNRRMVPRLRRTVSVVFQEFKVLPHKTVKENIALPMLVRGIPKAQMERRTNAICRVLRLEKRMHLACRGLSGGEQQRVAIARAVVTNPKLLLSDEPTGNLDEELSTRLLEIFKQFNQFGTTIFLATHNRRLIDLVPQAKVLVLDEGRLEQECG
ncbi:MAG: ATP-binding cassette domain-containing protein [Desulfohalobiaceae bacterium]|nr:ATP-binding cassette domain-containing protein [Desulfohalobiaceae bacterium]